MAAGKQQQGKRIALIVLAVIGAVLVWRNLIQPARQGAGESLPSAAGNTTGPSRPQNASLRSSPGDPARRDKVMDQQELAALDPTIRMDLLEKVAKVKYEGVSRNIFQFYTPPPPKPVVNPIVAAAAPQAPLQPVAPPQPTIALKFYGMSGHPGTAEKKAFLTDGEEIFIGQEGDVVAKRYKIVRIGMNSLEWEDMQTHQHGQLPLVQE